MEQEEIDRLCDVARKTYSQNCLLDFEDLYLVQCRPLLRELMKIAKTSPLYQMMATNFQKVVDFYGPDVFRDAVQQKSVTSAVWAIWNIITDDLSSDDMHPRYKRRQRIIPCDPNFGVYSIYEEYDINDDHIDTALKHIAKNLGLIA